MYYQTKPSSPVIMWVVSKIVGFSGSTDVHAIGFFSTSMGGDNSSLIIWKGAMASVSIFKNSEKQFRHFVEAVMEDKLSGNDPVELWPDKNLGELVQISNLGFELDDFLSLSKQNWNPDKIWVPVKPIYFPDAKIGGAESWSW